MIRIEVYGASWDLDDALYTFEMPSVPHIGEKLTFVADGRFDTCDVVEVQHLVSIVDGKRFLGARIRIGR